MKNKTVLIQFLLFPLLTLIMENAITLESMPPLFFTRLFSVMYIGMAPLTAVASILSEEKEKNTLRVLTMANVKPGQYLTGIGTYVWVICMIGAGVMSTGFSGQVIPFYLLIMGIGFAISILAGACVGIYAKNQMAATSIVMPLMMIFAFAPMLAMFNEKIAKIAKYIYTQRLRELLDRMTCDGFKAEGARVLAVNVMLMTVLFTVFFKRKGLE